MIIEMHKKVLEAVNKPINANTVWTYDMFLSIAISGVASDATIADKHHVSQILGSLFNDRILVQVNTVNGPAMKKHVKLSK